LLQSFRVIAKSLGSALISSHDLRREVLASLRKLIAQNAENGKWSFFCAIANCTKYEKLLSEGGVGMFLFTFCMPTRNVMVGILTFKEEVVKSKMQSTTNLRIAFFAKVKLQTMDKKQDYDCKFSQGLQTLKVLLTSNKIVE
jgi:hypothetical protein